MFVRKDKTIVLCLLFFMLLFVSCQTARKQTGGFTQQLPNVILFLVDDLGWTDVGCYGSDLYQTPFIDQLAAEGVKFTNAYASCTVCSPTRASIMTGKYPARLHITDWISGHNKPYAKLQVPDWQQFLPHDKYTLAEALRNNGYATAHIGKWHLGEDSIYWPEHQGFDINKGGWSAGAPSSKGGGYFSPYANPRLPDGPKGEYLNERLANEAVQFIKKNKNKPFFLNFWLYNVHTPLQAKKEVIDKYRHLADSNKRHKNAIYAAMIESMDDNLRVLRQTLEQEGLDKNTLIIFTSDNGGLIGNYKNVKQKITANYPLRSGKGDVYEGGVRVPFIVWWKEKIEAGQVSETPVISMDIYNTILSLTGSHIKNKKQVTDGVDLTGLLLDKKEINRDALYWHYPHYHLEGAKPYSAIRLGDWKLIEVFEEDKLQLYNLKEDIGEKNNLVRIYPQKAQALHQQLKAWRQKVGAQMPVQNHRHMHSKEDEFVKAVPDTSSCINMMCLTRSSKINNNY